MKIYLALLGLLFICAVYLLADKSGANREKNRCLGQDIKKNENSLNLIKEAKKIKETNDNDAVHDFNARNKLIMEL